MTKKKKSTDNNVLTSIARTVGATAGIIVSAANRLTASGQKSETVKPKRRATKKNLKASIKPKSKTAKTNRKTLLKKRK